MKQKKLKNNYESEDTKEVKSLIIITLIIAAIAVGLYFFTEKVLNKKSGEEQTTVAEFNNNICTVGTMFNRPEDKYYVFLFDSTRTENSQYQTLLSNYRSKDDSTKIYYVDLSKKFNSFALSDTSNKNPKNVDEVKINNNALIFIENKKVTKYYETTSDYEKVLS